MHESLRAIPVLILSVLLLMTAGCTSGRLGQAILDGDTETVQRLLDQGADPNLSIVSSDFAGIFLAGDLDVIRDKPFLTTAVELGHVEIARSLLEAGADPNIITDAPSPLYFAGRQDFIVDGDVLTARVTREAEMTRLLLQYGADPNLITHPDLGSAPIHVAFELETMLILFPITNDEWYTEQLVSNRKQHPFGPLVSALTDMRRRHEFPPAADNLDAFPPLTRAVLLNDDLLLNDLIDRQPETFDARDRYGFTPLIWAASRLGHANFVQRLLDAGADSNVQGDGQWTALHSAIEADDAQVIRRLCAAGADPNHRIHYQLPRDSPLMLAACYRHAGTVRALLEAGSDPLARTVEQYSSTGLLEVVEYNQTRDRDEVIAMATAAVENAQRTEPQSPTQPED